MSLYLGDGAYDHHSSIMHSEAVTYTAVIYGHGLREMTVLVKIYLKKVLKASKWMFSISVL